MQDYRENKNGDSIKQARRTEIKWLIILVVYFLIIGLFVRS